MRVDIERGMPLCNEFCSLERGNSVVSAANTTYMTSSSPLPLFSKVSKYFDHLRLLCMSVKHFIRLKEDNSLHIYENKLHGETSGSTRIKQRSNCTVQESTQGETSWFIRVTNIRTVVKAISCDESDNS
jgi:hypothetical protein